MSTRRSIHVVLEITPLTPLVHGAGNRGNEQILRTSDYLVEVPDPDMPGQTMARRIKVPGVSGSALKATLREHAFGHLAEVLGLEDGALDRDKLRLLLKGGKNDSGGQTVSLDEHRRLRHLFPMLAVFGSMDGGMPVRGEISVSPIRPFCAELVDAGLLPREIGALEVSAGATALEARPAIIVFPDRQPVPLHTVTTREEFFRHDMRTSPHLHYLEGEAHKQLEDKAEARKGSKVAKKEERRDANESMPHSLQAIAAGTPMVAEIRMHGATDCEWEVVAYAIARWISHGGYLGGGRGRGLGQCKVRLAGGIASTPGGMGATHAGTAIALDRPGSAYLAHLEAHADAIRAELLVGKAVA